MVRYFFRFCAVCLLVIVDHVACMEQKKIVIADMPHCIAFVKSMSHDVDINNVSVEPNVLVSIIQGAEKEKNMSELKKVDTSGYFSQMQKEHPETYKCVTKSLLIELKQGFCKNKQSKL